MKPIEWLRHRYNAWRIRRYFKNGELFNEFLVEIWKGFYLEALRRAWIEWADKTYGSKDQGS